MRTMRGFSRKNNGASFQEEQSNTANRSDNDPTDSSLASRSSSSRAGAGGGAVLAGGMARLSGRDVDGGTPPRGHSASSSLTGAAGSGSAGSPAKGGSSNKKMLKIGRNVRFRGDVMECDTVILCGRLEGFLESRRLTIKENGSFVGDAKVEEAEIFGSLDGSLESTSRIAIRSTGSVMGTGMYRRMTMDDGAELEGTYQCSARRSPRGAAYHADPAEQVAAARALASGVGGGDSDLAVAFVTGSTARESSTVTPPLEPSPVRGGGGDVWRRERGFVVATPAGTASSAPTVTAAAGTGAASEGSMWWSGSYSRPAMATSDAPPPSTVRSSVSPTAAAPVGGASLGWRISPRRDEAKTSPVTVPGLSPGKASVVVTPKVVGGVKTVGLSPPNLATSEAGELFGAHVETPKSVSNPFMSQGGMTPLRTQTSSASSYRDKVLVPVDTQTVPIPPVAEARNSVAAKIGMWPPLSPTHSRSPVTLPKRADVTASPKSTLKAPAAAAAVVVTEARTISGPLSGLPNSEAVDVGGGQAVSRGPGAGVGMHSAGSGGSGASGLEKVGSENGVGVGGGAGAVSDESSAAMSGTIKEEVVTLKACEGSGCVLEACWGDPRFRPRYCVAHKRQGHKLMDPVEQEEGDQAAAPDRSVSPPAVAVPDTPAGSEVTAAMSDGQQQPRAHIPLPPPPYLVVGMADATLLPPPSEPIVALDDILRARPQAPGIETEGEPGTGGEDGDTTDDEDDGWDRGGVKMMEANGSLGGKRTASFQLSSTPRVGREQAVLKKSDTLGAGGGVDDGRGVWASVGGLGGTEAEKEGEVLARVATFERLAKKTPKSKGSKRPSGNNIADFYAAGAESDEDEEETNFSMDTYNKGILLSQAAEVGTHTEDGQLRPQASEQRDQQRLAHLVRVGKLGSALRGKGVSAVGKRR